jgi:hypothetical protein
MHSDLFSGIETPQGRWQHGEKVGYCYPSGLEKTLCKWDIYVPLVTIGLSYRHSPPVYPTHNLYITYTHQDSNLHNQWQFRINYSGLRFDYLINLVMKCGSINQLCNDSIQLAYAVVYKFTRILSFCLSPILQILVYGELLAEEVWLCTCKSNWPASHIGGLCHSSTC